MFTDEEPELRDLIVQNLEKCGFLNKIKAELRAGVFLALEEDGNLRDKIPLLNKNLNEYARSPEGNIMLSLVREFLEFFNLNFTLSVFDPEVALSAPFISRSELHDKFKLKTGENEGPIISTLLKDIIGNQAQNLEDKSNKGSIRKPEDHSFISYSSETVTGLTSLESTLSSSKAVAKEEKSHIQKSGLSDYLTKISEEETKDILGKGNSQEDVLKDTTTVTKTDISKEINSAAQKENQIGTFEESKDLYRLDDDAFYDYPVPSEKTSLSFPVSFKDKNKLNLESNTDKNSADAKRSNLTHLGDLPALNNPNSWITNKDSKDNQQSLDRLKSFSDTIFSNTSEPDSKMKGVSEKKDSDVIESNEESSEKQISEESIEEEIEEDFSAGMDDLLNSLSLGEDGTTDQSVSQVSVVDGVDHVEPCNS